jgi:hypothetical protein
MVRGRHGLLKEQRMKRFKTISWLFALLVGVKNDVFQVNKKGEF